MKTRGPIDTWIFDLDNTLYPARLGLVEQINTRMTRFVMRELRVDREQADRYREQSWRRHGITLHALMADYGTSADRFLAETHDIDYGPLAPAPRLAEAVARLPGRRIVHTNGARIHAERVLDRLGLRDLFDGVWAIEDAGLIAKPAPEATRAIIDAFGFEPGTAIMLEDSLANLASAKASGMQTVWITREGTAPPPHVDHVAANPVTFLTGFA